MDITLPELNENNVGSEEDELQEEEILYKGLQGRRRTILQNENHDQRNIRRRRHTEEDIENNEATSSKEDASSTEDSTSKASSIKLEQNKD